MELYYFRCRSVTYAQRASKVLERVGIQCVIVRLPQKLSDEGCGYSIKVSQKNYKRAYTALRNMGFDIVKVFVSDNGTEFKEVRI